MRIFVIALLIGSAAPALGVQVGDTRASVLAELGEPQSKMSAGSREFLTYLRGRIEITSGRVSEIRGSFSTAEEPPPAVAAPFAPSAPAKPPTAPAAPKPTKARWYTLIDEAKRAATKDQKLILALFTGTDWCPPCQQFKAEVENDEQFAGIFSGSFIFFKSDWLRNTPQPALEKEEVTRLKLKYLVTSYPTLLVLNAEGDKLATVEWTKVQGGSFKEVMIEAIDEARKATKGGKKAPGGWWPF